MTHDLARELAKALHRNFPTFDWTSLSCVVLLQDLHRRFHKSLILKVTEAFKESNDNFRVHRQTGTTKLVLLRGLRFHFHILHGAPEPIINYSVSRSPPFLSVNFVFRFSANPCPTKIYDALGDWFCNRQYPTGCDAPSDQEELKRNCARKCLCMPFKWRYWTLTIYRLSKSCCCYAIDCFTVAVNHNKGRSKNSFHYFFGSFILFCCRRHFWYKTETCFSAIP